MNIDEYMEKVIALFKSGKATESQYREMAKCVLNESESEGGNTEQIDKIVLEGNHEES